MQQLTTSQRNALLQFLNRLIDQSAARILVPSYEAKSGFWFGGGNMVQDDDGSFWICGRYRNFGDSRTGLEAGARGTECALFHSDDGGETFQKMQSWSKAELSFAGREVLSIEGTALHRCADGSWELFISSEKALDYPEPLQNFKKPGTGVWTIDRVTGATLSALDLSNVAPALENWERPEYLHIKDPVIFDAPQGQTALIFCSHPFSWASSNSGLALRETDNATFAVTHWEVAARGAAWDVAATRITARMAIPKVGLFAESPPASIYFYDGAECLRQLDENARANKRPRGYSCEEIGGAFFGWDDSFPQMERLSELEPLFISPWGTGCSRYVETLTTADGIHATWEQGQQDQSQPLVGNFVALGEVVRILGG